MLKNNFEASIKEKLAMQMSGFLTCNCAHVRCVAQYFMNRISLDYNYSKTF